MLETEKVPMAPARLQNRQMLQNRMGGHGFQRTHKTFIGDTSLKNALTLDRGTGKTTAVGITGPLKSDIDLTCKTA